MRTAIESKILDLQDLARECQRFRQQGKRVVQCHGCFDFLHVGHVRHLEAAAALGDVLVVTVTADEHVAKGPSRPLYTLSLRMEFLAALEIVDYVAASQFASAVEVIRIIQPSIFAKGSDYRTSSELDPRLAAEARAAAAGGGQLVFTDDPVTFSSTKIIQSLTTIVEGAPQI